MKARLRVGGGGGEFARRDRGVDPRDQRDAAEGMLEIVLLVRRWTVILAALMEGGVCKASDVRL